MTENDAQIVELETQRNFMATRSVQFAGSIATLRQQIKAKDELISELRGEIDALKAKATEAMPSDGEQ